MQSRLGFLTSFSLAEATLNRAREILSDPTTFFVTNVLLTPRLDIDTIFI